VLDTNAGNAVMKHGIHSFIVVGSQGGEVMNTFLAGTISQPAQQRRREASALPGVRDRHRHLGTFRIFGVPDEASDTEAETVAGINCPERLVVVVVDLGEVVHLCGSQARLARQEPQLTGLWSQPGKSLGQQPCVLRLNRTDHDDRTIPQRNPVTDH